MRRSFAALSSFATLLACAPTRAIILRSFDTSADPTSHSTAPTGAFAGSGWQYVGQWGGSQGFTGIAIGPHTYVTAAHIDPGIGSTFSYNNVNYTATGDSVIDVTPGNTNTSTDLRIMTISGTFPSWAPLYDPSIDGSLTGKTVVMIGRGTQRSSAITVSTSRGTEGTQRGWTWGSIDGVQRWGTNIVTATGTDTQSGYVGRPFFQVNFDNSGLADEGVPSDHDSGGGVFVQGAGGVWKLAGVIHGVLSDYKVNPTDPNGLKGAIYDYRDLYYLSGDGTYHSFNSDFPSSLGSPFPAFGDLSSVSGSLSQLSPYLEAGDANRDGKVNSTDFMILASNFNKSTGMSWDTGDFNSDGRVNALDFNALATNFGVTYTASAALSSGTVVPEPTSIGLIILAGLGMSRRSRRR